MWRHQKNDSGQALVEYAIVFPLLMVMVLGIFEFSRIIYSYNAISSLARESTRFAVVPGNQAYVGEVEEDCPGTNPIVRQVCSRSQALALPGKLHVTVSQPYADVVNVKVEYEGEFVTNLIWEMLDHSNGGVVLKSAAAMRLE